MHDARVPAGAPGSPAEEAPARRPRRRPWRREVRRLLRRSLTGAEEWADVAWARLARRLGQGRPRSLVAYRGYGNSESLWLRGRLLANRALAGPGEDDRWFDNLRASYQRWGSREIAHEPVRLTYAGEVVETVTDHEGYYQATLTRAGDDEVGLEAVVAEAERRDGEIASGVHRIFGRYPGSSLLVISDLDDTVIHTGITNLLLAARLTFFHNARTRKPLPGVAALYRALQRGTTPPDPSSRPAPRENPVFYVSTSPWNLYDLLHDFLELNALPDGPILLRDVGLEPEERSTRSHKPETIRRLLARYPELPAVLIGDSGQHDAEIYGQIAREQPERIRAVYIRDVDPGAPSRYDQRVDRWISEAGDGIPFLRVADSAEIAEHAASLGLLETSALDDVYRDVGRDRQRAEDEEELVEELEDRARRGEVVEPEL